MDMSRSFDRSTRNPANSKKPRLITEESPAILRNNTNNNNSNGNGRGIVQRQAVGFRNDVDRDGSEGYQPQSLLQIKQQQHQELVSQYRTALAELTFNSKPIITNLTIIAGENTQAAKAIAATICNNIIEVPSDQKLPSLYLLDSIVKNIGRDYIKHFSTRLPEVFCKAYRQVDSALHSGMRHLFGTWKGVFPPQTLQSIEKELGFQSAGNGSSSGLATARPEPQPQQPARSSIHVNPKFMGAGQKLQLSNRVKGAASDITANRINSPEDTGRQNIRATTINPQRARADPRLKLHQAQRDAESDLTHENSGTSYNNFDFGPDISSERVTEQGTEKSWYGSGNNTTDTISRLTKHGLPSYSNSRPTISDVKLHSLNKGGGEISRSWKNSEEEEYMWDDVNSATVSTTASKRDPRLYFDPQRPGVDSHFQKPQRMLDLGSEPSAEHKDQPAFRQQIPSLRSKGSPLTDEDGHLGSVRKLSDNTGAFSTSFSGLADGKAARSRGQINTGLSSQSHQDSLQINPQISKVGNSRKSQLHNVKPPSPQLPIKQTPFLPPYQPESVSANPLVSSSLARPKSLVEDIPKPSSSSSLLASVSSIFANKPISSTSSSNVANAASNPVSSLLSTLVAKGLISAAKDDNHLSGLCDSTLVTKGSTSAAKDDHHLPGQSVDTLPSREVSAVVVSSVLPTPSTSRELSSSKPIAKSPVAIPQSINEDIKCDIGFVFKPDVIREFHPSVISDLIDDLPHQCNVCGLRFKLQERFDKHLEWHTLKINSTSRKWFSNSENWINGCPEEALEINGEMMVNADEGQCVCVLCGEMFDDFYSEERNKWMFKGAAYLDITIGKVGNSKNGVIVHVNCISEHSLSDLELANGVKIEKGV